MVKCLMGLGCVMVMYFCFQSIRLTTAHLSISRRSLVCLLASVIGAPDSLLLSLLERGVHDSVIFIRDVNRSGMS